jgi:hypothetical protein
MSAMLTSCVVAAALHNAKLQTIHQIPLLADTTQAPAADFDLADSICDLTCKPLQCWAPAALLQQHAVCLTSCVVLLPGTH